MNKKTNNSFSKRASSYDSQSFVQDDVNNRLLDRLNLIKHYKKDILEIGSGTGCLSQKLKQTYPSINLTSMDLSHEMLLIHKNKNPHAKCINAKAEYPPFKHEVFDTILSSLTLHWCEIDDSMFKKYHSLLKPEGLFLFSVAGPDTFKELENVQKKFIINFGLIILLTCITMAIIYLIQISKILLLIMNKLPLNFQLLINF